MSQSRSRSTDKRYYGVAEALVTDVRNDGKVKLTYPWFNEQMESEWARVVQFFAGPGHGAFFIPKIDSEVLVAFIHGDMRFPVVLGGLFNGQDQPPGTDSDMDTHVRHYRIQSPTGHRISMLDPEQADAVGALIVENSSGDFISMSTNGTMCIKAQGVLKLEAANIIVNGRVVAHNANTI
ncbi:MAG: phage baseplate assembly protein V [Pirellulaceae bacterium]